MSMMAPEKENLGLNLGQGQSQQRMSYDALTTLAHAAAASNAPPVSSAPRRARSKRAMTIATTGTTLLRVDENPGSGASTPRHTPKKTPHATPKDTPTKANMGKLLVKSPSKGSFVGSVEPSASSPLRKNKSLAPGSGPSTPSKSKRDSLGLYDQEGFLLSSPFRGKQEKQEM
ncbi:hypothetical protein F503_06941 [Ophiostoma piceae UAMH 11346]|uniref:Uncharacterized protein n=1 Tax=Ophiostoma piceae (strain UAMH 11346) TaxID=1262450 RepID=S3D6Z2_OPHP1|nr:hypothetical protein F503_06941 [Ophiostoma piceae UAMH 11346]